MLQPDEYHTLRRGLDQLWGLNSLPDEAALGATEHPGGEPDAGVSSRAPAPAAAAERGAATPSPSALHPPKGESLRSAEASAGVSAAAQAEACSALGRAGASAGIPGPGYGSAAAHGAPAGFSAQRGGAEAASARPSAGAAPVSGGPGEGVGCRDPGALPAASARAFDLFPVATAPAVHPLAAAPGQGGPGRLRGRRARESTMSAADAAGGSAQSGAACAAAVYAGNMAASSTDISARTGSQEAAAQGGAAEAADGGGGSAAAADSPGPNPSGAARPLSREQRRARALVASVLPFDAVTFRSRRRSEQVPHVTCSSLLSLSDILLL